MLGRAHTVSLPEPDTLYCELGSDTGLTKEQSTFGRADAVKAIAGAHPEGATRLQVESLADTYLHHPDIVPILTGGDTELSPADEVSQIEFHAEKPVLAPSRVVEWRRCRLPGWYGWLRTGGPVPARG